MLEVSFSEKTGTINLCGPKTSFLRYSCNNTSSKKHPAFNLDHLYCAKIHIFEAHRFQNTGHDLISRFTMPSTGARYFGVVRPLLKAMHKGV